MRPTARFTSHLTAKNRNILALNKNRKFSSQSLYREILNPGVVDARMRDLWKENVPLKIKIFVWMCFRGRIQVTAELKKKGWPGDPICKLCGESETAAHLIFNCPLSHFLWWAIKETFGWDHPPASFDDFVDVALRIPGCGANFRGWAIFGAASWAIWLARNDFVFNNKLVSSPLSNLFSMSSLLNQWSCLLPARRETSWELMLEQVKVKIRSLQLLIAPRRGVG